MQPPARSNKQIAAFSAQAAEALCQAITYASAPGG
jgi:hypothetical protein